MKVHQAGQPSVVALMGCSMSEVQENLLLGRYGKIVLMLDGDVAGQYATRSIANRLSSHSAIDVICLTAGQQPDRMSSEDIQRALSTAARWVEAVPK